MPRRARSKHGEIPRGALRAIVLALLAEKPLHGYALCKTIETRTEGVFRFSEGSLYPLLHELELEGSVEPREGVSETGRKRRVYHLTPAGEKETESWRKHWLATANLISDLLTPTHEPSTGLS